MKGRIINYAVDMFLIISAFSGWFMYAQEQSKNELVMKNFNNALDTEEIDDALQFVDSIMYYKTYYDLVNRQYGITLKVEKTDSSKIYSLDPPVLHGWK